jgi:hypothetical protein
MPRRPKYTTEMLQAAANQSLSVSELMVRLGLRLSGGGHSHIKRRLAALGIETSHFLGTRTNSGPRHAGGPAKKAPEESMACTTTTGPRTCASCARIATRRRRHSEQ